MNRSYTDIHHHIVYGIDDGAQTLDASIAMLEAAYKDGTRTLVATSHISPGLEPFDLNLYTSHLQQLQAYCHKKNLPVRILPGTEILYTDMTCHFLHEQRIPALGNTDYILVEFQPHIRYEALKTALDNILRCGYMPVIAHVERYSCLLTSPKLARQLKIHNDVLFQMNCSSVIQEKWSLRNRFIRRLLEQGLIDLVASDAHNTQNRPTKMTRAFDALEAQYGVEFAEELTGCSIHSDFMRALHA